MEPDKITCPKCKSENITKTFSGQGATAEIIFPFFECKDCKEHFFEEEVNF